MTTLNTALVLVHLVCMAALVGGYFVAVTQAGTPNPVMVWGARLQLLSGVALMGVATAQGGADAVLPPVPRHGCTGSDDGSAPVRMYSPASAMRSSSGRTPV